MRCQLVKPHVRLLLVSVALIEGCSSGDLPSVPPPPPAGTVIEAPPAAPATITKGKPRKTASGAPAAL